MILLEKLQGRQNKNKIPNSDNPDRSSQDVEGVLINLLKWPTVFNQFLGQFPNPVKLIGSKNSTGSLPLRTCTMHVAYTILLILTTLAWDSNYFTRLRSRLNVLKRFGMTEHIAHNFMVIMTSATGTYLQVSSILNRQNVLTFFTRNCGLLRKFQQCGFDLRINKNKRMNGIRRYGITTVIASTIVVVGFVTYQHFYTGIKVYLIFKRWLPDVESLIGIGFWVTFSYLRMCSPWILILMKLYTALFQELEDDLENFRRHLLQRQPTIFLNELFVVRRKHDGKDTSLIRASPNTVDNLNARIQCTLDLLKEVCDMIKHLNDLMGAELLWDISNAVTNITIYFFLACFYYGSANVGIVMSIFVPLSFCAWKVYVLSSVAGRLTGTSKIVIPKILRDFPVYKLDVELKRKVLRNYEKVIIWNFGCKKIMRCTCMGLLSTASDLES